jgi:hypothetical protein
VAEAQLTSTIHYNQLLRAEIQKRKEFLAAEKEELHTVERNAKAEEALRKKRQRRVSFAVIATPIVIRAD